MRAAGLLLLGVIAVGCGGAPPAPTPIIIYVTPPPTPLVVYVTPAPVTSTVPGKPTFSVDDQKIDAIIRDGAAKMLDLSNQMANPPAGQTVVDVFDNVRRYSDSQITTVGVYRPVCTQDAVADYVQGMTISRDESRQFVDYFGSGIGTEPDTSQFSAAGRLVGQAVSDLNADCK